jgi:endonuclease/exonuclease/phosphatase (EEP) superfamily protein YafD
MRRRIEGPVAGSFALFVVGGGALAATFLGFLGSAWWPFDLVANFRVQLIFLLLLTALLYLIFYDWMFPAALAVGAILNAAIVMPLFFGGPAPVAADSPVLRIVSFNVLASNPAKPEVMDYLRTSNADLVFLLESSIDWEDAISRASLPFTVVASPPADRTFGITALARSEVDARVVRIGLTDEPAVEVTAPFGDGQIQVLAIHPLSPISGDRSGGRDAVIQSAAIWARSRTEPAVVVGDLNATPWSHAFGTLAEKGDLVNSLDGFGFQPTWPAGQPWFLIAIDHLLHTKDLTTVERSTGPANGSDHRPIEVTLGLAAED